MMNNYHSMNPNFFPYFQKLVSGNLLKDQETALCNFLLLFQNWANHNTNSEGETFKEDFIQEHYGSKERVTTFFYWSKEKKETHILWHKRMTFVCDNFPEILTELLETRYENVNDVRKWNGRVIEKQIYKKLYNQLKQFPLEFIPDDIKISDWLYNVRRSAGIRFDESSTNVQQTIIYVTIDKSVTNNSYTVTNYCSNSKARSDSSTAKVNVQLGQKTRVSPAKQKSPVESTSKFVDYINVETKSEQQDILENILNFLERKKYVVKIEGSNKYLWSEHYKGGLKILVSLMKSLEDAKITSKNLRLTNSKVKSILESTFDFSLYTEKSVKRRLQSFHLSDQYSEEHYEIFDKALKSVIQKSAVN